jgi:hypothetical protein
MINFTLRKVDNELYTIKITLLVKTFFNFVFVFVA